MSENNVSSPRTPRLELWHWLVPPLLTGLALRWIGLRAQVLTGDELHSVHGALEMSVAQILRTWTFGGADYCVPLTAAYRLLMDQGVVFSELSFRVPSLLAGLVAIVLLPWLASPRIGRAAAIAFAWLLALSPMLVFYSRIARSYMPAMLAAGLAVLLFDRWLRQRQTAAGVGYVLSGAAAVYLHLGAAPLVVAPLLYAALRAAPTPDRLREWARLAWPALGLTLLVAALLFPAQESLLEVIRDKRDGDLPSIFSWIAVVRLQLGTREWVVAALALAALARGAAVMWATQRDFLLYLATLVGVQAIGLMILAPDRMQERAILNRYLLVALPLWLIPLAVGLATTLRRSQDPNPSDASNPSEASGPPGDGGDAAYDWSPIVVTGIALVALFATGPLSPVSPYWTSSFTNTDTSVDFLGGGNWTPLPATPRFYRSLATSGDDALIEYPWQNLSSHAFDSYQHTHGAQVIVSSVIDRSGEKRIALHNRAEPTAEGFLASRARYLVVHVNLLTEASRVLSSDPHHRKWLKARQELWEPLRRAAKLMTVELQRQWGPPSYRDSVLRVWDLDLIRGRARDPAQNPAENRQGA